MRQKIIKDLRAIPALYKNILKDKTSIARIAKKNSHFGCFLFLGRNINYPSAMEGALKLKEISYIPAEGYAAGEMKHGPIALIDEYRAVVCIAPQSKVYEKMISNMQEIRARCPSDSAEPAHAHRASSRTRGGTGLVLGQRLVMFAFSDAHVLHKEWRRHLDFVVCYPRFREEALNLMYGVACPYPVAQRVVQWYPIQPPYSPHVRDHYHAIVFQ